MSPLEAVPLTDGTAAFSTRTSEIGAGEVDVSAGAEEVTASYEAASCG